MEQRQGKVPLREIVLAEAKGLLDGLDIEPGSGLFRDGQYVSASILSRSEAEEHIKLYVSCQCLDWSPMDWSLLRFGFQPEGDGPLGLTPPLNHRGQAILGPLPLTTYGVRAYRRHPTTPRRPAPRERDRGMAAFGRLAGNARAIGGLRGGQPGALAQPKTMPSRTPPAVDRTPTEPGESGLGVDRDLRIKTAESHGQVEVSIEPRHAGMVGKTVEVLLVPTTGGKVVASRKIVITPRPDGGKVMVGPVPPQDWEIAYRIVES